MVQVRHSEAALKNDKREGGFSERKLRTGPLTRLRTPWGVISVALFLAVWTMFSAFIFSPLLLPSPLAVAAEGWTMLKSGELITNTVSTLQRLVLGYVIGVTLGTSVGLICGRVLLIRRLVLPIVNLIRPLSPVALVPLFIIWFGVGETSKVLLVSYTTTVTLFFSAVAGVGSTPNIRERAVRMLGATRFETLTTVVLPSAVPQILTGMRIAVSNAFMSVVAAELMAAQSGLGFLIMGARVNLLTTRMFVGLATLGILGLLADILLRKVVSRFGRRFVGDEMVDAM